MTLSYDALENLAALAKIELDDAEKEGMLRDLLSMVELAQSLKSFDEEGVEASARGIERSASMREDIAQNPYKQEDMLANAPQRDETAFLTPKVLDES